MKLLAASDVWPPAGYETQRDAFRSAIIALKKVRRVPLGDRVTLVFENRDTLLFQVQEMLRVERLSAPEDVQRELDVYNELVPGDGELSATLFIEITDLEDIRPELDRLVGLDEHVSLEVGGRRIPAEFDPKQMEEDRISAVQYVRFPLDAEARAAFATAETPVSVRVDHPAYDAEAELSPETRASLLEDLTGRGALLLPPPPSEADGEREIFRADGVRAFHPRRPHRAGHVVVEPEGEPVTLLEATPAQLAACQAAVQRAARELGRCRIESAAGPDEPLRFHLIPETG